MRSAMPKRSGSGFILSETLLAFLIALWLVPLTVSCAAVLGGTDRCDQQLMDETAAIQLRRILLTAYDLKTDGGAVYFQAQGRNMTLSLVNRNIIIQPGTQIIFADVDSARFYTDENTLIVVYERDAEIFEKAAAVIP